MVTDQCRGHVRQAFEYPRQVPTKPDDHLPRDAISAKCCRLASGSLFHANWRTTVSWLERRQTNGRECMDAVTTGAATQHLPARRTQQLDGLLKFYERRTKPVARHRERRRHLTDKSAQRKTDSDEAE